MEPSGSFEPAELKLTLRGAVPDVGVADATATGGVFGVPVGNTNSVMLCAGAVNDAVLPLKPKSASLVIDLVHLGCTVVGEVVQRDAHRCTAG